jgi:hypothetical protein
VPSRCSGVVDAAGAWVGGTTHLVQTGDLVDRGDDSIGTLELLWRIRVRCGVRVAALRWQQRRCRAALTHARAARHAGRGARGGRRGDAAAGAPQRSTHTLERCALRCALR